MNILKREGLIMLEVSNITNETAIFAGGCFWCMVKPFDEMSGVVEVISGYTGGRTTDPTYDDVCRGESGHYEAVEIRYNPTEVTYSDLLDVYFRQIDPTDEDGQFNDRGESYKPAIFYTTEAQRELANEAIATLEESGQFDKPIAVEVLPGVTFYRAEDYHQDFYKKESSHYSKYRKGSGREAFIRENWEED